MGSFKDGKPSFWHDWMMQSHFGPAVEQVLSFKNIRSDRNQTAMILRMMGVWFFLL